MTGKIKKNIAKGAIERIADLERNNVGLAQALNQLMMQSNERFNNTAEVIAAVVEKIGPEEVQRIVEEKRVERDAAQVARAEAWLDEQVSSGKLVPADVLGEKSTLVGVEYTVEGEPIPPGRIQIPFSSVLPDLKPQLEGKGAGTRITTAGGTTFEVLEIYDAVDPTTSLMELPMPDVQTALSPEQIDEALASGPDEVSLSTAAEG